jgi:hypothetical protein
VTAGHDEAGPDLRGTQARLDALKDLVIEVVDSAAGPRLLGHFGNQPVAVTVRRDLEYAAEGDVRFVGSALSDLRRLVERIRTGERLSREEAESIESRLGGASPSPWTAFIESDGGQGGGDVIRITERDDEPDLYLWFDNKPAPSEFFRFVAAARQDIPTLLDLAR